MQSGAEEILLLSEQDRDSILEGYSSNFFALYTDGTFHTSGDGVLGGSIRGLLIRTLETIHVCILLVLAAVYQLSFPLSF